MRYIKKIIPFFVLTIVVTSFSFIKKSYANVITPPHEVLTAFSGSIAKYREKYSHYVIFQCNTAGGKGEYRMILYNGTLKISNSNHKVASTFEFSQDGYAQCDYWANGSYFEFEYEGTTQDFQIYDGKVFYSNNVIDLYGNSFHPAPLQTVLKEGAKQIVITVSKVGKVTLIVAVSSLLSLTLLVVLLKKLYLFHH